MLDRCVKPFRSQITNEVSWGREFSASLQHGKSSWRTFWSWKVGICFLDLHWKSHQVLLFPWSKRHKTPSSCSWTSNLLLLKFESSRVYLSCLNMWQVHTNPWNLSNTTKAMISTSHPDLRRVTAYTPGNFGADFGPNDKRLDVESFSTAGGWHPPCKLIQFTL